MAVLTGKQIAKEVAQGNIYIDPFCENQLNPNSYNLRLADHLLVYAKNYPLHADGTKQIAKYGKWQPNPLIPLAPMRIKEKQETVRIDIPEEGICLFPGVLYLGSTVEKAGSCCFVPHLEGRSSVARLGIYIHVTAGFGDLGFGAKEQPAHWTLEIVVVHPVLVVPNFPICQIVFTTPQQDADLGELPRYTGKYKEQKGAKASQLWRDFESTSL